MRDWDTRISELKKNIEAARNRFVIPFLDSKYLEEQTFENPFLETEENNSAIQNEKLDELKSNYRF